MMNSINKISQEILAKLPLFRLKGTHTHTHPHTRKKKKTMYTNVIQKTSLEQ